MFLTDKYHALLPVHSAKDHRKAPAPAAKAGAAVSRFDAALAARLGTLLPLPASPLAALARLADLLTATLGDAVPALSTGRDGDAASAVAFAAHLDSGVALLDACNAIAARVDRLRRRRLISRLALHLLSSPSPTSVQRARAALSDRDGGASSSPPLPLPPVQFVEPPRGNGRQLTAAARVLLAVNAVSSLAATAAATILRGDSDKLNSAASFPLVVTGDLPWTESFNALSSQLAVLAVDKTSEVNAVDEAVSKLAAALDSSGTEGEPAADKDNEAAVRAAAQEVEKRTEELAALLDRLSDAVNGVFRAALRLRNAELGSFGSVGPADKTRKK